MGVPCVILGWWCSVVMEYTRTMSRYSATFRQVHFRLAQFARLPLLLCLIQDRRAEEDGLYVAYAASTMLGLVVDIFTGLCFAVCVHRYEKEVIYVLQKSTSLLTIDSLRLLITWLTGVPGGFKLNNKLDYFLASIMYQLLSACERLYDLVKSLELPVVPVLTVCSLSGITILGGAVMDLLSFVSLYPFLMNFGMCHFVSPFMSCLSSLFSLFRGRKLNILKQRMDTLDYSFDQLLLGSILFPCFVFLTPTVLLFYLSTAAPWTLCLFGYILIQLVIFFLQRFPHVVWVLPMLQPVHTKGLEINPSPCDSPPDPRHTYWVVSTIPNNLKDNIIKPLTYQWREIKTADMISLCSILKALRSAQCIYPHFGFHTLFESVYDGFMGLAPRNDATDYDHIETLPRLPFRHVRHIIRNLL
ncbi:N-acetylglucosaminyl transferase component GPI1 [Gregarina niphandrodes]|uniref:N-acetylglucosaminyl transferase component GPI1 n=1 Tax=Gregarina niphandrodes TaxID=110365 RepID=A0A023B6X4_GRENI|nr:N-acetylglucosaminyl transferase component GPI1 [Gregarina niphandrodes]EZG66863.1 N-acetylglucosaminyl transferase component GPI1 [Gregarina niphandrodes]|eukprot:XP_011130453.1 N-acetylglucosaminyl transferase component GPI1 [Gregarina niphandrodes]